MGEVVLLKRWAGGEVHCSLIRAEGIVGTEVARIGTIKSKEISRKVKHKKCIYHINCRRSVIWVMWYGVAISHSGEFR